MKLAILGLFLALAVSVAGCVSQGRLDEDPLVVARQMQAMGFHGRLIVVFGSSHVAGVSWNATGSSGFMEITLDPNTPPAEDPGHPENTRWDADPPRPE